MIVHEDDQFVYFDDFLPIKCCVCGNWEKDGDIVNERHINKDHILTDIFNTKNRWLVPWHHKECRKIFEIMPPLTYDRL